MLPSFFRNISEESTACIIVFTCVLIWFIGEPFSKINRPYFRYMVGSCLTFSTIQEINVILTFPPTLPHIYSPFTKFSSLFLHIYLILVSSLFLPIYLILVSSLFLPIYLILVSSLFLQIYLILVSSLFLPNYLILAFSLFLHIYLILVSSLFLHIYLILVSSLFLHIYLILVL
jgi:hypothetical protein